MGEVPLRAGDELEDLRPGAGEADIRQAHLGERGDRILLAVPPRLQGIDEPAEALDDHRLNERTPAGEVMSGSGVADVHRPGDGTDGDLVGAARLQQRPSGVGRPHEL